VRPAHGLVALHGTQVLPVSALGLTAGRVTHGHRFQGAADIELAHAGEYAARLDSEGAVIADFGQRRHAIERLLFQRAEEHGTSLGERENYLALLDEVTALVERPAVYSGAFEAEFLSVPPECLILTMKLNQKYFPLFFSDGSLSSRFLIVSNMRLDNPHHVIEGNQRVVRPRLADARFFFDTDKKTRLEDRVPKLANVVYHNKLGNQLERTGRVKKLAGRIALLIGADEVLAERAAYLAKADLLTDMVGEFPELQGIMGRYYALNDGESAVVADAIAQHYQPRFAGDGLPGSRVALSVALADKMETLVGLFGIGQHPTGDKDPFALRRHALGVLRMLMEKQISLPLSLLIDAAFAAFPPGLIQHANSDLGLFMHERLRGMLREPGFTANEVEAVITRLAEGVNIAPSLLAAVRAFGELPEAASLAAANKRIGNILAKSAQQYSGAESGLMVEPAERALYDALNAAIPVFDELYAARDFTGALKSLAPMKAPVDAFFDQVMVNAEDRKLRENRLALLHDLHVVMNKVADLSKLAA
jgi:glycyl-tRNA synthetase beta chain